MEFLVIPACSLLDRFGGGWHPWTQGFTGLGSIFRGVLCALALFVLTGHPSAILALGSGFLAEKWFWSHKGPLKGALRGGLAGLTAAAPMAYFAPLSLLFVPIMAIAMAVSHVLPNPTWRGPPVGASWSGAWNEVWRGALIGGMACGCSWAL